MTNDKLLPCPFCGGEAMTGESEIRGVQWVRCFTCRAELLKLKATNHEVIAHWNTRAIPAAPKISDQVVDMLERMPTLHDQFAMAALSGMLANPALVDGKVRPSGPLLLKQLVADAVVYADAMLEARKK